MELFQQRIFFEVRYSSEGFTEKLNEIRNLFQAEFIHGEIVKGELSLKQGNEMPEAWEIKVGPKRFCFAMGSCPSYEHFAEVFKSCFVKVLSVHSPPEIFRMELRGHHLYPLDSMEEFFELITSLREYSLLEFSDLGVRLSLQVENWKINTIYRHLNPAEVGKYFLISDYRLIPKDNLTIDIDISLDEPIKQSLAQQPVRTFINRASLLIRNNIEKITGINSL